MVFLAHCFSVSVSLSFLFAIDIYSEFCLMACPSLWQNFFHWLVFCIYDFFFVLYLIPINCLTSKITTFLNFYHHCLPLVNPCFTLFFLFFLHLAWVLLLAWQLVSWYILYVLASRFQYKLIPTTCIIAITAFSYSHTYPEVCWNNRMQ
jgi:hypothetical protein